MRDKCVVILTNRELEKLDRCVKSIENTDVDVVIFCNTLDLAYPNKVRTYAEQNSIPHFVTESNGSCGKGKNSVLDWFETSKYEYLLLIDGDDYYARQGVDYIVQCINELKPDVLGQRNHNCIVDGKPSTWEKYIGTIQINNLPRKNLQYFKKMNDAFKIMKYNRLISFSKKCVKDFRYSVEHSGQDILGMLELYSKSNNLKYVVTETLVYHYVTGEGLMSEAMQTISQDMYDHYDILLEKIDRLEFKESKYVTID
mgnify:CR=1 FL=1